MQALLLRHSGIHTDSCPSSVVGPRVLTAKCAPCRTRAECVCSLCQVGYHSGSKAWLLSAVPHPTPPHIQPDSCHWCPQSWYLQHSKHREKSEAAPGSRSSYHLLHSSEGYSLQVLSPDRLSVLDGMYWDQDQCMSLAFPMRGTWS